MIVHAFWSLITLYEHCSLNLTFKDLMKIRVIWRVVTLVSHVLYLPFIVFFGKGMFFVKAWMIWLEPNILNQFFFAFDVALPGTNILWNFVASYLSLGVSTIPDLLCEILIRKEITTMLSLTESQ